MSNFDNGFNNRIQLLHPREYIVITNRDIQGNAVDGINVERHFELNNPTYQMLVTRKIAVNEPSLFQCMLNGMMEVLPRSKYRNDKGHEPESNDDHVKIEKARVLLKQLLTANFETDRIVWIAKIDSFLQEL